MTVNEVNVAPVVTNPGDQTDAEGTVVSLPISATDADLPANTLRYGAVGLPPGLSIDPVSGVISGTVAFGCNAGSPHAVTVTVTDDGTPEPGRARRCLIGIARTPTVPPVLDPVGDQTIDELALLTFTATAIDPDVPVTRSRSRCRVSRRVRRSIRSPGCSRGRRPKAQGPGSYTFDVVVTDDGTPILSDSETITVTVNEVNVAPVLDPIGDQTVDEQTLLTFTATATDADLPANTLTFSLSGEPAGAAIDPVTGVFTWTPTEAQGPGCLHV